MRKLSTAELGRLTSSEALLSGKLPVIVVLDNLRSALNVGSIFRTADAFRAEAIYLCGVTAVPPHRDILKSALGATDSVRWRHFESVSAALKELKDHGYEVLAIEQTDSSVLLQNLELAKEKHYALVLGNEVSGVSAEALPYCDRAVEIPQGGAKHSLNVSVCAGVILWEFAKHFS